MAQRVKHLNLGFGSGQDLRVVRSSPTSGSMLCRDLLEIHSLSLSLNPSSCSLALSQINTEIFKNKQKTKERQAWNQTI